MKLLSAAIAATALSSNVHSALARSGRSFLVADFYERDSGCDPDLLQMSMLQEVGAGCIDRPLTWLPDTSIEDMMSYEIISCTNNADELDVMFMVYSEKACAGNGQIFTSGNSISPSECYSNEMSFSCQRDPPSLHNKWPAVDIFFDNSTCHESAVTVSAKRGCITMGASMFGWNCNDAGTTFIHEIFENRMTCADNVPSETYEIPTEECLTRMIRGVELPHHIWERLAVGKLSDNEHHHGVGHEGEIVGIMQKSYYYEGFYTARCRGY